MQHCDARCGQCSRHFFTWLKSRMAQMNVVPPKQAAAGCVTPFAVAAATSVRPPRLPVGTAVQVPALNYPHTAVVVLNSGAVGLDGRHWVRVCVETATGSWEVHFEDRDLSEVRAFGRQEGT